VTSVIEAGRRCKRGKPWPRKRKSLELGLVAAARNETTAAINLSRSEIAPRRDTLRRDQLLSAGVGAERAAVALGVRRPKKGLKSRQLVATAVHRYI
jgi:hypothetical protein